MGVWQLIATNQGRTAMHHSTTHRSIRTTHRSQRPALSPYLLDDTALTLSDIRQARAEAEVAAGR
jgi:hypothetical protein